MKREAREIECNTRTKYVGGINEDMTNMKKDMERYQDEAVRAGTTFASAKAELCRLSSNIDGARGQSISLASLVTPLASLMLLTRDYSLSLESSLSL